VRVDPDGGVEPLLDDVGLANGLGWSPDGGTCYFIDTAKLSVDAFDYDSSSGRIRNRRTLVDVERGTGAPDGMAVDHDGHLWVAVPFTGEVRHYSPEGQLLDRVVLPTRLPTSCCFAGPDGAELFVTSLSIDVPPELCAHLGISDEAATSAAADQLGGALFVCRPGATGPPATPFAG
jgi:sugar lactone lactonase YvrE